MKIPVKVPTKKVILTLLFITLSFIVLGIFLININLVRLAGIFLGLALISGVIFLRFWWVYLTKKEGFKKGVGFFKKRFWELLRGFSKYLVNITDGIGRKIGSFASKILPKNVLKLTIFKDEKISLLRSSSKRRSSPYKRMKWKDLTSDTDRVRFVYYFFMRKKIKKGFQYIPSQTPKEICYKMWQKDGAFAEVELFDMYNTYRYNEAANATNKTEKLKTFI